MSCIPDFVTKTAVAVGKVGEFMPQLSLLAEKKDLWSYLKETAKPIVLYGMGDGADKILNVCEEKNIPIRGVFASDDFVRGQVFRGFTVKTYAAVKRDFPKPIILVSFASRLDSVMQKIYNLSDTDEVYAPDVPVFGTGLFDSSYFQENFDKFEAVYQLLADETSRRAYYNVLAYKLSGSLSYLRDCETSPEEAFYTIIDPQPQSVYVDIGAYNGDTIEEYISYAGRQTNVYAFEPDARNYRKLCENVAALGLSEPHLYNIAAWNEKTDLTFYARSGRNSAGSTVHKKAKAVTVQADCADALLPMGADYINIDAEGSDLQALQGLQNTLRTYHPTVCCAVYHRNEDMFALPLYLASQYDRFKLYLRHFPYIPAWDTNIYIVNDSAAGKDKMHDKRILGSWKDHQQTRSCR